MIIRWPGKVAAGQVSDDLVMSLDICATILEVAGGKSAVPLHGQKLFGDKLADRSWVFSARDRMGDTHDAMRAIRSKDFKLILNLMPARPWCQYSGYKEGSYPPLAEMNVLYLTGTLNAAQARFFAPSKPEIELFDLRHDPHEINNVADDPRYAETRHTLLAALTEWRNSVIEDKGVTAEFRAQDVFPLKCDTDTVDEWVQTHQREYDFHTVGCPPWYATRTLAQWQKARDEWEPWVFRSPEDPMHRP